MGIVAVKLRVCLLNERNPCFSRLPGLGEVQGLSTLSRRLVVNVLVEVVEFLFTVLQFFVLGNTCVEHADGLSIAIRAFRQGSSEERCVLINDHGDPSIIPEEDEAVHPNSRVVLYVRPLSEPETKIIHSVPMQLTATESVLINWPSLWVEIVASAERNHVSLSCP